MTSGQWRQIEELFHSALERAPADRALFLDETCAGDAGLREQVEKLLVSFDESGDFIERPLLADTFSSGRGASAPAESLIGQTIGNHEILRLLGAGGMGEVYLARDTRLDRQIALKLLPRQFTLDAGQVRRFEREARVVSALNHPNIITLYEIGREGDKHFITTEFIAGRTLREMVADGRIEPREAAAIVAQIASALAAAHAAGIVHRDIKPENAMLRPDGLVKVLDFGLAKPFAAERETGKLKAAKVNSLQTDPRMLMGTLAYLSPEQARGEKVDHRTDIFSLGVVLYEMIAGRRPFTGESAADTLDAILCDAPAPITTLRSGLPVTLERIVNRALEKDREIRYQSAEQMRNDLLRFEREMESAAGASSSGATETISPRSRGWNPAAALALIAATLAITGWIAWPKLGWGKKREHSPWVGATAVKLTDQAGPELFPSLAPDGRTIVYASMTAGNWDIWRQTLGERDSGKQLTNLTKDCGAADTQPAFSPDGRWVAYRSDRDGGGVFLMNVDGAAVRRLTDIGYHPSWSPDGRQVFCTRENVITPEERGAAPRVIWVVDVVTGEKREAYTDEMAQPQVSPHGYRIAYWGTRQGARRDIWTRPANGGEPIAVTNDDAVDWNPIWSPDGRYLYYASNRAGSMNLWRVAMDEHSGRILGEPEQIATPSPYSQHLTLSGDGRRLAYVQLNQSKNLFKIAFDPARGTVLGQPVAITRGSRRATDLSLSPDGEWIAFGSVGETREDIFILKNEAGGEWKNLTNDAHLDRGPEWSPDGKRIAFYSDRSGSWEIWTIAVDGGHLEQITFTGGQRAYYPIWSPDGARMVYTLHGGKPFVIELAKPWAAQTPQPLIPSAEPDGIFWPNAWSADGKRLAGGWRAKFNAPTTYSAYDFDSQRFQLVTNHGHGYATWLNDDRRLLISDGGTIFLVDTRTGKEHQVFSLAPRKITKYLLSRDNRWLYYSLEETEADIWMLTQAPEDHRRQSPHGF